ncbi:MAG: Phosphoenolpyruvate synthase [Microgenomates bacterium OLB22]|nr:MAG: Phosphoenolpyruvate synthase [Microgenomates bacterium OLB22]
MKQKHVVWFEDITKRDIPTVGGKGANLGEMLNAKFPVPYGFVVTAQSYFDFIREQKLELPMRQILRNVDHENAKMLEEAGAKMRVLILKAKMPASIDKEIRATYSGLMSRQQKVFKSLGLSTGQAKEKTSAPLVAVRSSATAEDLPDASFAGQQETYLNIQGADALVKAVQACWASLFTDRAIYYRQQKGFDHTRVGLAAVVQLMVQSDSSGVAFSIDPVTNDRDKITIEAIFGLGEYIVQGAVTPDHYEVDKKKLQIEVKQVKRQELALVRQQKGSKVTNVDKKFSIKEGSIQKITDEQIVSVATLVRNIEKHYKVPQDIEWAVEAGQVYIVQSRPITTVDNSLLGKATIDHPALSLVGPESELLLRCDPASPGVAIGTPRVLSSPKENDKVKPGDILVAAYTSPDYVPAMKRAVAIVTEMGGRTSHAAIVSRELGIPAIVGAAGATRLLKGLKTITVNGSRGEVFKGEAYDAKQMKTLQSATLKAAKIKTKTKIYVNLAQPESADRVAKMNVDGIGLLRAEFIVAHIGIHPKLAIHQGKQKHYIRELAKKLIMFVKPFGDRPVVYRATDFRTNEYRHLEGGETYEPHEENPMIGYRGASRYIKDEDVFAMEIEAIKQVRKQYKNLHLMIPFVRIPEEIRQIRQLLRDNSLAQSKEFKLWMMVEVPSSAIMVEEFIKEGIDGISIGTNDLTMLLLGVDRDNQEIAYIYDERRSVVLWALKRVIDAGKKHGITVSICGQAPSDHPELAAKLVKWGITSLSVTPDMLDKTRLMVSEIEKGKK